MKTGPSISAIVTGGGMRWDRSATPPTDVATDTF